MKANQASNVTDVQIVNHVYENNPIPFKVNGCVMINATKMAAPFRKRPAAWLRLPATIEFMHALTVVRKSHNENLIVTQQGGDAKKQGTWMHEDVALEFARWLSPAFGIWCNDRVKEILTGSYAIAGQTDELERWKAKARKYEALYMKDYRARKRIGAAAGAVSAPKTYRTPAEEFTAMLSELCAVKVRIDRFCEHDEIVQGYFSLYSEADEGLCKAVYLLSEYVGRYVTVPILEPVD